jgi:hypothetical protein
VAREVNSGVVIRQWENQLYAARHAPYGCGPEDLFVAYYSLAELGCHISLGWPLPSNIVDLYAEFRATTNGLKVPCGDGLLGAVTYYGIASAVDATEKDAMRSLACRGGPWTEEEQQALLAYCERDVDATVALWGRMSACWT